MADIYDVYSKQNAFPAAGKRKPHQFQPLRIILSELPAQYQVIRIADEP